MKPHEYISTYQVMTHQNEADTQFYSAEGEVLYFCCLCVQAWPTENLFPGVSHSLLSIIQRYPLEMLLPISIFLSQIWKV